MQSLYIHIPFCAQACHYCDFHFSTSLKQREELLSMISHEIMLRKDFLKNKRLDTIYFGGGTPSILEENEIEQILNTISDFFLIDKSAEITLEANPDDLTPERLRTLKALGINRLSIGIQSFNDTHLRFLNRIHSSVNALNCITDAQEAGFENLTIDLIYGIHSQDHSIWKQDLETALSLSIPHISAYCLTIEEKTVFGKWVKGKKMREIDEDFAADQFEILMEMTSNAEMEQYEISNFSLPGKISRHNSNYWLGGHYLGVGPSAHSYNGIERQYNISNNALYTKSIKENVLPNQTELLSDTDIFNEKLLTGIRTKWGFNLGEFEKRGKLPLSFPAQKIPELEKAGFVRVENGIITLTKQGKLIADKITADLFA